MIYTCEIQKQVLIKFLNQDTVKIIMENLS